MQLEKSDVPGQLAFFVVALAAHGYEPVSLRYFRLEPEGRIRHLTAGDIPARRTRRPSAPADHAAETEGRDEGKGEAVETGAKP